MTWVIHDEMIAFPMEAEQTGVAEIVHFNASGQSALDETRQILATRCLWTETAQRDDHFGPVGSLSRWDKATLHLHAAV